MADVFNLGNFIRMQVQNIQLCQILQISNSFDIVFTKHQDSESRHRMQVRDFFDVIVVKIQENKCWQTYQIFNFLNMIVLQVQETKPLFSLQERHMRQVSLVEIKPIRIGIPFGRFPIDDKHPWYLR
jgi:hypothetical protein